MQTTAIRTVANSLPENEVILLTLLISKRYIPLYRFTKNLWNIRQNAADKQSRIWGEINPYRTFGYALGHERSTG